MQQPTLYARWAYDAIAGALIQPTSDYQSGGMVAHKAFPATWFNYWWNLQGQWIDYVAGWAPNDWTRQAAPGGVAPQLYVAADDVTPEISGYATTRWAIAATTTGAVGVKIYASRTGAEWVDRTRLPAGAPGTGETALGLTIGDGYWYLWSDGHLWWTPTDTSGGTSALAQTAGHTWTAVSSVPAPTSTGTLHARTDATEVLLVSGSGVSDWYASTDGTTFAVLAPAVAPAAIGTGVTYDGTVWVVATADGTIYTTSSLATLPVSVGSLPGAVSATWRLASDGAGTLLAWRQDHATVYKSTDHGLTWALITLVGPIGSMTSVQWIDHAWLTTTQTTPAVVRSNDGTTWVACALPQPETADQIYSTAYASGSVVAAGGAIYQSGHARATAPGSAGSLGQPAPLADAGYLRGRVITTTAPTTGQVLQWDGTQWVYSTISGVGGSDAISLRGRGITVSAPADGQSIYWDNTAGQYQFADVPPGVATSIAAETSARTSGDSSTLASAESYTDGVTSFAAACPTTVAVGDAVYLTGANAVDRANAGATATTPVVGFVRSKGTTTTCVVQCVGPLGGFSSLTPGAVYYLAKTDGQITTNVSAYSGTDTIQRVGEAVSATELDVFPGFAYQVTPATSVAVATKAYADAGDAATLAAVPTTARDYSYSYAFGGGAHDYTLDANYGVGDFTNHDTAADGTNTGTQILGDGSSVPFFHAVSVSHIAANGLTRTAGGALRLTYANGVANSGRGLPATLSAPQLLIPIPPSQEVTVTCTLSTNAPGISSINNCGPTIELLSRTGATTFSKLAGASLIGASGSALLYCDVFATAENLNTDVSASVAGGIITYQIKLFWRQINAGVYGDPTGTPTTLRRGRQAIMQGSGLVCSLLVFAVGSGASDSGGTPANGLYAELSNLVISGKRWES